MSAWNPTEEDLRYVYGLCVRLCGAENARRPFAEAEDLAQETLEKAWTARGALRDPLRPKPWLRTIAVNSFLARVRGAAARPETEFPEGDPDIFADVRAGDPADLPAADEAVRGVRDGCFRAMSRRLNPAQRCAFALSDMVDLDAREAAALMGISVPAFRGQLHRARANMNAFFGRHCSLAASGNPCSCAEWTRLVSDRTALKRAVEREGGPPRFDDPDYAAGGDPATLPAVLAFFRTIPESAPPGEWFERAGETIALARSRIGG